MNTIKKEEFDYQQYMREHPPDSACIQGGPGARKQRFEAARMKTAIHIDEDILELDVQVFDDGEMTCHVLELVERHVPCLSSGALAHDNRWAKTPENNGGKPPFTTS